MYIRNIFIFNAAKEDRIRVNDRVVKYANRNAPNSARVDDLRVSFCGDFKKACDFGFQERIDSIVINADDYRGKVSEMDLKLLGRGGSIKVEFA